MHFKYIITTLIVSLSISGYSQKILGTVHDENGIPLRYAHVIIPALNKGSVSDSNGTFTIGPINQGTYLVQASHVGMSSVSQKIVVDQERVIIAFILTLGSTSGNEIVVSGAYIQRKDDSPVSIESMGIDAILSTGAPTMMESLTRIPGVSQVNFGPGIGKPLIRGLSFSRILTIYQGNRFENHQWGADHGLGLNETGVDRVEVIKGPASLIYGSGAIGGVVQVIEKPIPAQATIEGDARVSTFSNTLGIKSQAGVRGHQKSGIFWNLNAGHESHADYLDGNGNTIGNSRFQTKTIKAGAGIQKSWGRTRFAVTGHHQDIGIIEDDPELATTRNDRKMQLPFQDVRDYIFSNESNIYLGKGRLQTSISYHHNFRKEIEDDFNAVDLGLEQKNISYDFRYYFPIGNSGEWIAGIQGFRLLNSNMNDVEEILIPDARLNDIGLYGMFHYDWDRWNLQGGLRYDYRNTIADASSDQLVEYGFILPGAPDARTLSKEFDGFSGSIGAAFKARQNITIKSNIATGFRAPDLAELFSNGPHPGTTRFEIGNAEFDREQNIEGDLGFVYRINGLEIESGLFYNHINNYIFFSPTSETIDDLVVWRFEQANTRLYGMEHAVAWNPVFLKNLTFKSSLEMVQGTRRDNDTPLPMIPPFQLRHSVRWDWGPTGNSLKNSFVNIELHQVSAQNRIGMDEITTPGYHLVGMAVGTKWKTAEFKLTVQNLFDVAYFDHLALFRPFGIRNMGRNIGFHVRVPFSIQN